MHKGLPVMHKGLLVMRTDLLLPVMCEGLPVTHHDCNHGSHVIAMTS